MTLHQNDQPQGKVKVVVDSDIQELIPLFLQNRQDDIKSILSSVEQGDYETVRILGHSMKGAGGGYGFDDISAIGALLEMAAKERNSSSIKKTVRDLESYLERVEIVFQEQ